MFPPDSKTVKEIAAETGISPQTLYSWRQQALGEGSAAVGSSDPAHKWSDEAKLAVVIETAALNVEERSEYCRGKGLYPEQIDQWRAAAVAGQSKSLSAHEREQFRESKAEVKRLKKELARKEKALAEAAALMVLRKKWEAIYTDDAED
jgi:transposase-like protein